MDSRANHSPSENSPIGISHVLQTMDLFGKPVPGFKISGHERVNTTIGGFFTLFMMSILTIFGLVKLQQLLTHHNPTINTYTEVDALIGEKFDPLEHDFFMAVGLEEYTSKETKSDPRFVKWLATYIVYEDSQVVEKRSEFLYPCS